MEPFQRLVLVVSHCLQPPRAEDRSHEHCSPQKPKTSEPQAVLFWSDTIPPAARSSLAAAKRFNCRCRFGLATLAQSLMR
jgi:hypothetical protein